MGSTLDHPAPAESGGIKEELNMHVVNLMDSLNLTGHSSGNDIESESNEVETLVLSAKMGQWEVVWYILGTPEHPRKAYMLNAIPQHRRWGVIHQVVYWQDKDVLLKLLRFPGCDKGLKAKECSSECGATGGMTAKEIAQEYKYSAMEHILETPVNKSLDFDIATFQPYEGYCDNEFLCLVSLTLASYKKAFHPQKIDSKKPIMCLLKDIFIDIARSPERWKKVKDIVADSVYPLSTEKAAIISGCKTKTEFFGHVVRAYTNEDNKIYTFVNVAFRRQRRQNYAPTGDDLAIGPYSVMFQMLLLFWDDLKPESRVTYRAMLLTDEDIKKYTFGTRFVWQSAVSSASKKENTYTFPTVGPTGDNRVLFVIDNSARCMWQPRNIAAHADFDENERTYPAGARFMVTGKSKGPLETTVNLKLLPN